MSFVQAKRFTLAEYHQLAELGFFHEDDRVELIRGEIIQMAAKGRPHETCIRLLLEQFPELVAKRAIIQSQAPIVLLNNSEPEPDFAIVHKRPDYYLSSHPTASDILLLIEVSDSTLNYDQTTKLALYAEADISNYWIFNLVDNWLECYSKPYENRAGKFGYRTKQIFLPNEAIALPCFPDSSLDLSKVFPGM
jgi:Uma2 family endonuclease